MSGQDRADTRRCKGCGYTVSGAYWCDRCKPQRGKKPLRYGGEHQRKRAAERPLQYGKPCARCGYPMLAGQEIHLDHRDDDPTQYLGWSHALCNLKAGGRVGAAVTNGQRTAYTRYPAEQVSEAPEGPDPLLYWPDGRPKRQHSRAW